MEMEQRDMRRPWGAKETLDANLETLAQLRVGDKLSLLKEGAGDELVGTRGLRPLFKIQRGITASFVRAKKRETLLNQNHFQEPLRRLFGEAAYRCPYRLVQRAFEGILRLCETYQTGDEHHRDAAVGLVQAVRAELPVQLKNGFYLKAGITARIDFLQGTYCAQALYLTIANRLNSNVPGNAKTVNAAPDTQVCQAYAENEAGCVVIRRGLFANSLGSSRLVDSLSQFAGGDQLMLFRISQMANRRMLPHLFLVALLTDRDVLGEHPQLRLLGKRFYPKEFQRIRYEIDREGNGYRVTAKMKMNMGGAWGSAGDDGRVYTVGANTTDPPSFGLKKLEGTVSVRLCPNDNGGVDVWLVEASAVVQTRS
jgi:hypothetical protein